MYDLLQLAGGTVLAIGYVPQILKIVKTKSAKDFALKTYLLLFFGIACMEAYAVNLVLMGSGGMFLVTNTLSLLIAGIMCLLILRYQRHPIQKREAFEKEMYSRYQRKLCEELILECINLRCEAAPEKKREIVKNKELIHSMVDELQYACNQREPLVDIADDIVYPAIESLL